jgi:hypothetical protein
MHNNAIGPEICGKTTVNEKDDLDFNENLYVTKEGTPLDGAPPCRAFDASVEGRYRLYVDSMRDMLNPAQRIPKMHLLSADVVIPVAPKIEDSKIAQALGISLSIKFPKGKPALDIASLRFKDLIQDMVLVLRGEQRFTAKYQTLLDQARRDELQAGLKRMHGEMLKAAGKDYFEVTDEARTFIQKFYSNTLERIENNGHRFGESLSDQDKDALIAFVATL